MEQALRGCRRLYSVSQVRGRDVRFAQVGPTNGPTRISSSGDAVAACVCLDAEAPPPARRRCRFRPSRRRVGSSMFCRQPWIPYQGLTVRAARPLERASARWYAREREESESAMTALCKAYPTHEAASSAVAALRAAGVDGDRIRVLMGEELHDVGQERVGEFAGSAGPDAPVGSFAGPAHERRTP